MSDRRKEIEEQLRKHFDDIQVIKSGMDFDSLHKLLHVAVGIVRRLIEGDTHESPTKAEVLGTLVHLLDEVTEEQTK
jgi:hypothetical protein